MKMQHLVSNVTGATRKETLDGREYLVAPMTMIVPGILNGNRGRLLYPIEEITKNHTDWNNIPLVANHPMDENGHAVSARSPEIIRKYCVGRVFNASADGKLGGEAWFDVQKSRELLPKDLFAKIESGKLMELSTGLFTENEKVTNGLTEDGKGYDAIARNYRPDHLAILTDSKGACSVKDGCGINVNDGELAGNQESQYLECDDEMEIPSLNQLSHGDLREQLRKLIRERYGSSSDIVDVFDKTVVYTNYGSNYVGGSDSKYFQIGYTADKAGKVTLSEQGAVEVTRKTEYKLVTTNESTDKQWFELLTTNGEGCSSCGPKCGCKKCKEANPETVENENPNKTTISKLRELVVNSRPNKTVKSVSTNKENTMPLTKEQKKELIDRLISNEGIDEVGPWEESDRIALNAIPDVKLAALGRQHELLIANMDGETDDEEEEGETPTKKKKGGFPFGKKKPTTNVLTQKQKSLEDYLAELPAPARSVVVNALNFEQRQKVKLVKQIVANEKNEFSEDYLNSIEDINVLQGIAALATNEETEEQQNTLVTNYAGVAGFTQNLGENFRKEDSDMIPQPYDWSGPVANSDE